MSHHLRVQVGREVRPDAIRYTGCETGRTYLSLHYHRSPGGRTHDKGIWTISCDDEFGLFCDADCKGWSDARGRWGVLDGAQRVLGSNKERIALFPEAAPDRDWHGFPLHLSPVRRPAVALAQSWIDDDVVSFAIGQKIKRGKL